MEPSHSGESAVAVTGKSTGTKEVNLEEVTRLVEALEKDLAKVKGDSVDVQRLRQEVEALKVVLRGAPHEHHRIPDALHKLRERFDKVLDEAVFEGLEISRYVNEIGRMLGLG
jgi:cell division septum initiation protein DivIVA